MCFKAVQKKHAHQNLVYGEPEDDKRVPRKIPRPKLVNKKRAREDDHCLRSKPNLTQVYKHNVESNVTRRECTENVCFKAVQKKHAHQNLVYAEPEDDNRVLREIPRVKLVNKKRAREDDFTGCVPNLT